MRWGTGKPVSEIKWKTSKQQQGVKGLTGSERRLGTGGLVSLAVVHDWVSALPALAVTPS